MNSSEVHGLKQKLAALDPIYDVFIWTTRCFPVSTPKGIVQLFKSLATPSPVCVYFPQGESIEKLSCEMFNAEVKSKISILAKIRDHLPLFYHVLVDLFESCLPSEWKPLIQFLISMSFVSHIFVGHYARLLHGLLRNTILCRTEKSIL